MIARSSSCTHSLAADKERCDCSWDRGENSLIEPFVLLHDQEDDESYLRPSAAATTDVTATEAPSFPLPFTALVCSVIAVD